MRAACQALLITAVALLPGSCARAQGADPQRGAALAAEHCARCHAVGSAGASQRAEAPPFRDLHRRYPVEHLAEALAEGIVTGHPEMPEFRFEPEEADDFIAYLRSLE